MLSTLRSVVSRSVVRRPAILVFSFSRNIVSYTFAAVCAKITARTVLMSVSCCVILHTHEVHFFVAVCAKTTVFVFARPSLYAVRSAVVPAWCSPFDKRRDNDVHTRRAVILRGRTSCLNPLRRFVRFRHIRQPWRLITRQAHGFVDLPADVALVDVWCTVAIRFHLRQLIAVLGQSHHPHNFTVSSALSTHYQVVHNLYCCCFIIRIARTVY